MLPPPSKTTTIRDIAETANVRPSAVPDLLGL